MTGEITQAIKKWGGPAALGVAAGAVSAGVFSFDLPAWAVEMLKQWGPGGVLIAGFAWFVPRSSIKDFFQSQKDQAVATQSLADAVTNLPQRDEMKFESILISQSMLERGIEKLDARLNSIEGKIDGAKR
ncbi:MAG: hypothetical protein UY90_C0065G0013 [Candidatus Peregrinibacteria bacterium GW2011_GWA2_54_9]|nr:MAG: hypothetical protein UY90_C0065G0013 [Candidatus Peregrinibacteria bacterium GW2011_GWA2_54_9]